MQKSDGVVVTGAGGFIGGHLVAELVRQGFTSVRAVDLKPFSDWYQRAEGAESVNCDMRDRGAADVALAGCRYVFNYAADMGGMGFIESNKARCMLSVVINTNLLSAAIDQGIERYFFSSSACVYPVGKQASSVVPALAEDDAYPAMPEDGYGWEKLFSERMCHHFSEDFGLATRIARYHNVYGPRGSWRDGREKAPAAICRKVAEAKVFGFDEIEIWGDGEQARSFMFIDDCVRGTLMIMDSDVEEPLNIGSSEVVTINQLVDLVEDVAGISLRRRYNMEAPQGVRGRNSDNTRIRRRLGWEPSIPLNEGIAQTYAWIYEQVAAQEAPHGLGGGGHRSTTSAARPT